MFFKQTGVAEKIPNCNLPTDIPGLRSRVTNPLEFLGLYGTLHEACHRHHIPAIRITGDANEEQIIAAGQVNKAQNYFQQSYDDAIWLSAGLR